jgi:hypothetical protein
VFLIQESASVERCIEDGGAYLSADSWNMKMKKGHDIRI